MIEHERDAFGSPVPEERAPEPPRSLLLARILWIVAVLVGFVQSYVELSDRERLLDELSKAPGEMSQTQLDSAVNAGIMFTLMISVILLLVLVLLCRRMLQGRNWVRIVLTIFGGLNAVGTVGALLLLAGVGPEQVMQQAGVSFEAWDLVFSVVLLGIEVAAIVMMFQPESNRFFREMRGRPLPGPGGRRRNS